MSIATWHPTEQGLVLGPVVLANGQRLELPTRKMEESWHTGLAPEQVGWVITLGQFWLDGRIDSREGEAGSFVLPWEEAFVLSPSERRLLALSDPVPVTATVEPDENILSGRPPLVDLRSVEGVPVGDGRRRVGAALVSESGQWRWVGGDIGRMLTLLDSFPPRPRGDPSSTMLWFSRFQALARSAGAELRGQLATEEYVPVDQVEVDVVPVTPEEVELRPAPVGVPRDVIDRQLQRPFRGRVDATWSAKAEGKTVRYCLSPMARQAVASIRKKGRLRGKEIPQAFEAPESTLGAPDEVLDGPAPALDLRRFGDRVIGVSMAPTVVKAVVARRGSGEGWKSDDVTLVTEELPDGFGPPPLSEEVLHGLLEKARETGEPFQLHEGRWFDLRDAMIVPEPVLARRRAVAASRPEAEPEEPGATPRPGGEPTPRGELVIHENLEQVTFEDTLDQPDPSVEILPTPSCFAGKLFDYQQYGFSWLSRHAAEKAGGLLADDMGLGKTAQVIALFARLKGLDRLRPVLCVLPASLIPNWRDEIHQFCPDITKVHVHQGPGRVRNPDVLAAAEVVLTTYETMGRDQLLLGQVRWTAVVLDEAQRIKNATTGFTRAAKGLNGRCRVAMSGTPVENSLNDLWCIIDYCQPGLLGSRSAFNRTYSKVIENNPQSPRALQLIRELKDLIRPVFLRRTKEQVATDIPPKHELRFDVPLSPEQEAKYVAILNAAQGKGQMMAAVNQLVRVCSHDWELEDLPVPLDTSEAIRRCPKLAETLRRLAQVAEKGEKALVFSRYRNTQRILQSAISLTFRGRLPGVPILNGDLEAPRRQTEVNTFNNHPGFAVMVLSTDATGVGLNITGANHVFHFTRVWNPAKEAQATDRVHRIKQTRPVTVYYPIAVSPRLETAEVKLDRILQRKSALAGGIVVATRIEAEIQKALAQELARAG